MPFHRLCSPLIDQYLFAASLQVQLVITLGTVKSHINHILVKLDVHNRTEAVARAQELGLLRI